MRRKGGVALTPELRAQIAQTADQWALASAEAAKLAEAQNRIRETAEDMAAFQKDLVGGIANDFINGASAADVFANALGRIAQKLIDIGLANIFDTDKGGFNLFGALGGIFRKNGGPVKRAGGGIVRGPGGPRGDKIPAMLSDEEFVVNAAATKRNRALLEAINSGRVIGLKDGGSPLRAPSMPILRSSAATQQARRHCRCSCLCGSRRQLAGRGRTHLAAQRQAGAGCLREGWGGSRGARSAAGE
ncbi:hypothetical protein HED49_13390 [Ochrobactrum daejeonense]|nr:hypothetical protein [Brucella daejeonensis]